MYGLIMKVMRGIKMKVVIDIDDFIYDGIRNITDGSIIEHNAKALYNAIYHGTPTRGSYEQGYNTAKREIALSGELKRAYNRGYEQACKDKIESPYKEADDDYKNI